MSCVSSSRRILCNFWSTGIQNLAQRGRGDRSCRSSATSGGYGNTICGVHTDTSHPGTPERQVHIFIGNSKCNSFRKPLAFFGISYSPVDTGTNDDIHCTSANSKTLYWILIVSGKCRQSSANIGSLRHLQADMIIKMSPANAGMIQTGNGYQRLL